MGTSSPCSSGSGICGISGLLEKLISRQPGRIFERPAELARPGGDVTAPGDERHTGRRGQITAEQLVLVGLSAAELMIEMCRRRNRQPAALLERAKNVKERHRVRAARQRHEHTRTARKHLVLPNRAQDAGRHGHFVRDKGEGRRENVLFSLT